VVAAPSEPEEGSAGAASDGLAASDTEDDASDEGCSTGASGVASGVTCGVASGLWLSGADKSPSPAAVGSAGFSASGAVSLVDDVSVPLGKLVSDTSDEAAGDDVSAGDESEPVVEEVVASPLSELVLESVCGSKGAATSLSAGLVVSSAMDQNPL
jgi:hypothetical protein